MNLKSKVGIILIAFSVLLYFAGYFFLVEHAPNPITNTLNFFNSILVIELLCLANEALQLPQPLYKK
jgi:hypothetical protein